MVTNFTSLSRFTRVTHFTGLLLAVLGSLVSAVSLGSPVSLISLGPLVSYIMNVIVSQVVDESDNTTLFQGPLERHQEVKL